MYQYLQYKIILIFTFMPGLIPGPGTGAAFPGIAGMQEIHRHPEK
jgi:hypothetical protein